jgi:hypothetical protein
MSAFQDGVDACDVGDYALALEILVPLAEQGNVDSASLAGTLLSMHMHRPDDWFDIKVRSTMTRVEQKRRPTLTPRSSG